jgi:mRNA interferase HigB
MRGTLYNARMRIISRKALRVFWEKHPEARQSLQAWYADVKHATWKSSSDIKRVIFNVKGNRYRVIVAVQYKFRIVFIRFVGTHQEYEQVDPRAV